MMQGLHGPAPARLVSRCVAAGACSTGVARLENQMATPACMLPMPWCGVAQMVKRVLAGVPTTAQALCASPYLDTHLFAFDDKLISAVQRPRPYSEQPLKFMSRAFPERSRFKARLTSFA